MKKRLLAMLLCACMVLGLIPGGAHFANATSIDTTPVQNSTGTEGDEDMPAELKLTEDGWGYCPVCQKEVKWSAMKSGMAIGSLSLMTGVDHHFYFSEDNMTTSNELHFLQMVADNHVCLHLNGKKINMLGSLQITGGTLNLIGDGHVDFQGNGSDMPEAAALLYASSTAEKKINIYGGQYTTVDGKQILLGNGGSYSTNTVVKLYNNAQLEGIVNLNQSQLYLQDSAKVQLVEASNSASVRVDGNWNGSATVDYFADYLGDYVSQYNGRCTGAFKGMLKLADGRQLVD